MTQKQEDRVPEADSLDDLFNDAMLAQAARNPKKPRAADPSLRNALDAAAKKMRELYTLPENWERTRGIALIDRGTQTLIGNFSEYKHRTIPGTRKLLREHSFIAIDAREEVDGYIGEQLHQRLHGRSWTEHHSLIANIWLDEMMLGAPMVQLNVCTRLGVIERVELEKETQLASAEGQTLLVLPAGTDISFHLSQDTKVTIKKGLV